MSLEELLFWLRVPTVEVGVQTDSPSAPRRLSRKASSPIRSRDPPCLKRKQTTEIETQTRLTNLKVKMRKKGTPKKVSSRSMGTDLQGLASPQAGSPSAQEPLGLVESKEHEFVVAGQTYMVYKGALETSKEDLVCDPVEDQFNSSATQTFPISSGGVEYHLPYEFYQPEARDDSGSFPPRQEDHFARREISIQADEDGGCYGKVIGLGEDGEPSQRYGLLYEDEPLVSLSPSGRLTPTTSMLSRRPPSLASSQIRSSSIETQTDHDVFLSTHVLQETPGESMVDEDIILTSTETQTDREAGLGGASSPPFWCTSETQTCEDFSDIEPFLCSTIHTQTMACGDLHSSSELFPELGHFTADTQTQTGMDEAPSFVTTHTQTSILGVDMKPTI